MKPQRNHTIKKWLWAVVLAVLWIPLIQGRFKVIPSSSLHGDIKPAERVWFSLDGWLTGKYQEGFEKYENEHFGFRNMLVRLNNQMYYSLFGEIRAKNVVEGRDGYFYEQAYIDAVLGRDYAGAQEISNRVTKMKAVYDTLHRLGTDLVILLAPGKGSFFPEYFPQEDSVRKGVPTNYGAFCRALDSAGLPYLDFRKWFLEMKPSSKYPLFAKAGIHWSKYGEYLAADSLVRYISAIRKIPLPPLVLDTVIVKSQNQNGDYDIGEGMNLLCRLSEYPMGYPVWEAGRNDSCVQPPAMVVSDSYYWGLFRKGFSSDVFFNGKFWFYNQLIYPDSWFIETISENTDVRKAAESQDVIVLISTDANLAHFDWGFTQRLYKEYFEGFSADAKEKKIEEIMRSIRNTPEWLNSIQAESDSNGTPLEALIRKHAEYVFWQQVK